MMSPHDHAKEIVDWYFRHYSNKAEVCERLRRHASMLEPNDPDVAAAIFRVKKGGERLFQQ